MGLSTPKARELVVAAAAAIALTVTASAAEARNVYFTNNNALSVSVVDSATNAVATSVGVGSAQGAIAFSPDGARAYAATNFSLSVIDTAANSATSIPLVDHPLSVAVTPDGSRVYVSHVGGGVYVISTASNTVVGSIGGLTASAGVAISPDGRRAYVADDPSGLGVVRIIDTETNALLGEQITGASDLSNSAVALAIAPDGRHAYVADLATTVSVVDLTTNAVGPKITVGGGSFLDREVAITPDGAHVYVTNPASNSVSVINTSTNSLETTIFGVFSPNGVAVSPDGKSAYVANHQVGSTTGRVIDTATNTAGAIIGGLSQPNWVAVAPDQGPTASFTASPAGAGSPTSFDASASSDDEGIAKYDWDFGDGATAAGGPTITHTYANPGTYTVTLTVTDSLGTSTQQVFTGQTVSRNGSAKARSAVAVTIADATAPTVTITTPKKGKKLRRRSFKKIAGIAADESSGVGRVEVALLRKVKQKVKGKRRTRCLRLRSTSGRFDRKPRSCNELKFLAASGTTSWQFKLKRNARSRLKRGSYTAYATATDTAGNKAAEAQVAFHIG